ncbi:MAG: (4Fe-4S)-binding protein, partial [Deltaproteobacteria bacterium]|nr:(4Fe-4S)-binding protein [Deltaproteobacteria bacterium]
ELASFFKVPAMVCVNKADINLEKTREIEKFAIENGLKYLGVIPFDQVFTRSMVNRQTVFEYDSNSNANKAIKNVWEKAVKEMGI